MKQLKFTVFGRAKSYHKALRNEPVRNKNSNFIWCDIQVTIFVDLKIFEMHDESFQKGPVLLMTKE